MAGHAHSPDGLDELGLTEQTRADYLGGNTERVFTMLKGRVG